MAQDPYKYFRVEARELVSELQRGVLELEKGRTPDLARKLLRFAHTLKGAARVVKQPAIAEKAHAIEESLSPLREESSEVPKNQVERVLELLDQISEAVRSLETVPEAPAGEALLPAVADSFGIARFDASEIESLLDNVSEANVKLRGVRTVATTLARARHAADRLVDVAGGHLGNSSLDAPSTTKFRATLDDHRAELANVERQFTSNLDQLERELEQVQQVAERLRLVPAGAVFASLARTVFDAAKALGKKAAFDGKGGEVRLDGDVLGALQGALIQLVRNAVAHGIEAPRERTLAGKSAEGKVVLEIRRSGRRIIFSCSDDGCGIDVDAVRAAARKRGQSFGSENPSNDQVLRVLLQGGLSTAAAVTEVSGRGIGLDVVRDAVRALSGSIDVRTQRGSGTAIDLSVPVSLSSLDALLVEADGVTAAIPLDAVRRTLRLVPADIMRTADTETIVHDGSAIRYLPLSRAFGARRSEATARARTAVVLGDAESLAAVGVDRLVGTANIVVRPLPALAVAERWVAGASLDAEGVPRLVLDADAFVATVRNARAPEEAPRADKKPCVLVTDDSLTTRMLEQSILESAGYEVDLATSAEEALKKAAKRRYDLFLVDVEMPGMDGFSFVEVTRADPAQRDVPAILVSSRNAPEDKRRGEEAGATAYIVKSEFEQTRLLAIIDGLLRPS